MLDISVIIPTNNRHSSLIKLIESIHDNKPEGLRLEVIVVSNLEDSFVSSLSSRFLEKGLDLKVFVSGSLGVNKARNLGLKKARGAVSFLLDDDCRITDPFCFKKLLKLHRDFPSAVAIGGAYKTAPGARAIDIAYNFLAGAWQSQAFYGTHRSSRLVGGCVSYKTRELLNCGERFNEKIFFGGTESEFHRRLNSLGFETLFFKILYVEHGTRLKTFQLIQKSFYQAKTFCNYPIDGGCEEVERRAYQTKREVWALKQAESWEKFSEILYYIKLYDFFYNLTKKLLIYKSRIFPQTHSLKSSQLSPW